MTGAECFLMKPDFQLRDFGASNPWVSVKRNSSALTLTSRQPVIVTGACSTVAMDVAASAGVAGAGAADAAVAFPVPAWATGVATVRAAGFEDEEEDEVL